MGNAEQASIANIAFTGATNHIDVLVQNSGSTTVNITQAYVNGVGATITNAAPWSIDKSGATTFTRDFTICFKLQAHHIKSN